MKKAPVTITLEWSEAANLLAVAGCIDTAGWTRPAKAHLRTAFEKLAAAVPMEDPNSFFLIVKGQTVVKGPMPAAPRRRIEK